MKIVDDFNTRIGQLVDVYQGSVPLARCIIEATHQQEDLPTFTITRENGDLWLTITFEDGSSCTLGISEEM
jgi:hypothetical protein